VQKEFEALERAKQMNFDGSPGQENVATMNNEHRQ
jgi:hypothetical protein